MLESITQSEVSQKKNKYHIVMQCLWNLEKLYRFGAEIETQRMDVWQQGREGKVGKIWRVGLT